MVERVESLSVAIGARVRSARARRGWTLDQLAESAGVSRRMVVNVEQGVSNPSVGTLLKLGEALGVGLPALVEVVRPGAVVVTRAGSGPVLWQGDSGGSGVMVAGVDSPTVLELWEWRLLPGERRVSEAHVAGAQELLHVLEGSVQLQVAEDTELLAAGDAAAFAGDVDHAYVNAGKVPARFSLTVFEPARASGRARG